VLWFLLAPAEMGGIGVRQLILTLGDEAEETDVRFAAVVPEAEQMTETPILNDELDPAPKNTAASIGAIVDAADGSAAGGGKSGGGQGGPSGSFFGINAYGHEFVYVLDMSGSMRGRRYQRATAELIRSVDELSDDQNFYVLLFDDKAVQMFGRKSVFPSAIPATNDNKEKLAHWLGEAFNGGGTDPRDALRVALKMKPSAIFILSDGKFNGQEQQPLASMTNGNADAFSIVAACREKIPIHAIAFENKQSCENMKRLSEMTNGKYRFAGAKSDEAAKEALARARLAMERGERATAELLLNELISGFGETEAGWTARQEFAAMLNDVAQEALRKSNLRLAKDSLVKIVEMDPWATVTADVQKEIVTGLLAATTNAKSEPQSTEMRVILEEVVNRFPKSQATQQIIEPVAKAMLGQARDLIDRDELVDAMKQLESIQREYPLTEAAKESQHDQNLIIEQLMRKTEDFRSGGDDVESILYLRQLTRVFRSTSVEEIAAETLVQRAEQMLEKLRDANVRRDYKTREELKRKLHDGFENCELIQKVEHRLAQQELKARELLRSAMRYERASNLENARANYVEILQRYSRTLTARKAKDRLQTIDRRLSVPNEDDANHALEQMLESATSIRSAPPGQVKIIQQ
jgi:outer membrane protein assembly factor BamD (BamD/ComL family)